MTTSMTKPLAIATYTLALLGALHSDAAAGGGEEPSVAVLRLVVAKGIEAREPVGAATEFSSAATSHLFAFVEVQNPSAQPTEVFVSWIDTSTGKARPPYTLQIGAQKRWRSWMRAAAPKHPGAYEVVVTDSSGNELARSPFTMAQ